jgi:hypothetical protein
MAAALWGFADASIPYPNEVAGVCSKPNHSNGAGYRLFGYETGYRSRVSCGLKVEVGV